MGDVFLSYGPNGSDRVKALAGELTRLLITTSDQGDRHSTGGRFRDGTHAELREAKCVLVCWTGGGFPADPEVEAEATFARQHGTLIPIFLEPTDLAPPWNTIMTLDLTGWAPKRPPTKAWLRLLDAIGRLIGRPGLAEFVTAEAADTEDALIAWARTYPSDPLVAAAWQRINELSAQVHLEQMVASAPGTPLRTLYQGSAPHPLDLESLLLLRASAQFARPAIHPSQGRAASMPAQSAQPFDREMWQPLPSLDYPASAAPPPRSGPAAGRTAAAIGIVGALLAAAAAALALLSAGGSLSPPPVPAPSAGVVPPVPPPTPAGDLVEASAFAAEGAPPGEDLMVQVLLHSRSDSQAAAGLARQADPGAERRGSSTLDMPIQIGERITILLEGRDLGVDEPVQTIVWRGEPVACQFIVTLPETATGHLSHLRVRIMREEVPIGSLRLTLKVSPFASDEVRMRGESASRYRRAFLSYASADRSEVLKRVQGLRAAGIDFFQDILSIQPGENWSQRLEEEIDRCDVFLLFWSQSAAKSDWVLREIERAVERQSRSPTDSPDITPIVLEGPPPPRPIPPSLEHLHFSDYLTYAISAGETRRS